MPFDYRADGERTFADAGNHGLAPSLDPFGDGDLALAGEQLDAAHLAQIHAHGIIGPFQGFRLSGRFGGHGGAFGGCQFRALHCFGLVDFALAVAFSGTAIGTVGAIGGTGSTGTLLLGIVSLDQVDAHLREQGHEILDLLGGNLILWQDFVQLVIGDIAALLALRDQTFQIGLGLGID